MDDSQTFVALKHVKLFETTIAFVEIENLKNLQAFTLKERKPISFMQNSSLVRLNEVKFVMEFNRPSLKSLFTLIAMSSYEAE